MKPAYRNRRQQRGAVAIVFGLTLAVLLAMAGFVIDLGHLYIAKAELQNGADGAALAGAKELNESAAGIDAAVLNATKIAKQNRYDFSTELTLADANISFSGSPDGPWSSASAARANPAGMTFIQVDTGSKVLPTYLMKVAGVDTVSTKGVAVAGRFVVDVTPIGVCAIDPLNRTAAIPVSNELMELGFRRGITYNLPALGPLGASAVPILLNPVDSPPIACDPPHSSANFTAPFVCQGNSAIVGGSLQVYANTGYSAGVIEKALNSRFDEHGGGSKCDVATAPSDTNTRSYDRDIVSPGAPADWMNPDPIQQSISIDAATKKPLSWPANPPTAASFGVLWSYSRAVRASGTAPNYTAGTNFNTSDWPTLYNAALSADISASGYPTAAGIPPFPVGTPPAPYNQLLPPYFSQAPVHPPGSRYRRLLNVVIVDCAGIGGGGMSCATLPVKGIGKFFLQARADLTGGTKKIYGEFAGLIEPVPNSEIKLYK